MAVFMNVKLFGTLNVSLCTVYVKPSCSVSVLSQVLVAIGRVADQKSPLLILGDFNARHPQLGEAMQGCNINSRGRALRTFCVDHSLTVLNCRDCRGQGTRGSSVLDWLLPTPLTYSPFASTSFHSSLIIHHYPSLSTHRTGPV